MGVNGDFGRRLGWGSLGFARTILISDKSIPTDLFLQRASYCLKSSGAYLQSNLVLSALKTAPFSLRNWKQSSELEKPNSLWTKDTPTIGRNLHLLIGMISRLMKRSTNEKENRSFMLTTNNSQVKEQQNLLKEIKYLSKIHIK